MPVARQTRSRVSRPLQYSYVRSYWSRATTREAPRHAASTENPPSDAPISRTDLPRKSTLENVLANSVAISSAVLTPVVVTPSPRSIECHHVYRAIAAVRSSLVILHASETGYFAEAAWRGGSAKAGL